ncbi:TPA: LysR family transcriptional regulator [Klebsiella oxytoca]
MMEIFLSKKLRYFMVIMETRNFSKAADALCITRSPLSKVISELEQNLGDILFIRKHNELSPTSLAWACYNKCKPFYDSLRSMEDDYKIKANQKPISIIFDISIPELLFRHVEMIAKLEQLYVELKRELITTDTLYNLQHSENHAIISFRELGRSSNIKYNTWEACEVVLLSSQHAKNNNSCNEMHIWKDNYINYFKGIYSAILADINIEPVFIEHNFDISTLLYSVRSGKGMALMPYKMSTLYKIEGTCIQVFKDYHIKCHLYYNIDKNQGKTLEGFKKVLAQFI